MVYIFINYSTKSKRIQWNVLVRAKLSLSVHMFLSCFYPWPYILNVQASNRKGVNIFSTAIHVFHNLLWKITSNRIKQIGSNHMFEVFQGLFFAFFLYRKDVLGTRLTYMDTFLIKKYFEKCLKIACALCVFLVTSGNLKSFG